MKRLILLPVLSVGLLAAAACGAAAQPTPIPTATPTKTHDQNNNYNAYIVSSELRAVPIIESETNQAVGQAYSGFAISISDVRKGKACFYLNISDPSAPNVTKRRELYIPINHMRKAFVEPQVVPPIISLDMIRIEPMTGISLYREGRQQVIARFNDEIGPIQFIQNVQNG